MAIADSEIAQVRAATDIVALIGEQVALKRAGRRWSGLCPFHAEKTPSFSVNAEQGVYYCFGCRASGDAIKFVRETQHLDFREALQLLADKVGIELHDSFQSGPGRKDRQELLDAMQKAVAWYHDRLLNSPDAGRARQYLRSRGIDGDVARQFQLGWAPDAWDAMASGLGLSVKVLEGTGLGFENSRGRRQDFLRARIVFPIFDVSGRAIALGGRVVPLGEGETAPPNARPEPKYKNSPETSIYSKRRTLYALNFAKDDIIRSGELVVCEGYTDVIGFFGAGVPRAVATCGTALSEEHFRTLRNFAKRIVLAYDADAAGQSAAASVYQWEKKHEVDVFVMALPRGMDPGELAQNDPEGLRNALAAAVPFLQFRLERVFASANLTTNEGRGRAAEAALAVVAEHPVDIVRDQYLRTVADECRVDIDRLRPLLASIRASGTASVESSRISQSLVRPAAAVASRPGRAALTYMVHAPEAVDGRFVAPYFLDPTQRAAFVALESGGLIADCVDVLERTGEPEAAELIREISVEEFEERETVDRDVSEVAAQLIRGAADAAMREIDRDLRGGLIEPERALVVIKDAKSRLAELSGPAGSEAERVLREWLLERELDRDR